MPYKKNLKKSLLPYIVASLFILTLFILPRMTLAAGLIPCTNTPDVNGVIADPCGFPQFITLAGTIINYIFALVLPIAAIIFAYTGFLFLTSGGSTEVKSKAKGIFKKVVIGLILILAAWLIVDTILNVLGVQTGFSLLSL